jgi:Tol biopolymer transport system component
MLSPAHSALRLVPLVLVAALLAALAPAAQAQYFGRNKVQYDDFDFRVLETEHFDIYYYPEEEQGVRDAARMAERWYARLSEILDHEFDERKSIILYADDADFQQTNVIGGQIGQGTGGVTEGFKQRIVMPLTGSYADTDHVLGHELVHQFQYDMSTRGGTFANFVRLPLWIVEGFAEYLSVGRRDAHTAMWLRDAVLRDEFPTLDQLTRDPRFFPYRYGQAFWAYVGGTYGDEGAVNLFKTSLSMPLDSAIVAVTGLTPDSLSARWGRQVADTYAPLIAGMAAPPYPNAEPDDDEEPGIIDVDTLELATMAGRRVLAPDLDGGNVNVSPAVSPDGRYVAFLSERDLFGIDLFLADAQTGEVLKKLDDIASDGHLDALRFINSAGTWSPDGQKFAFVVFVDGDNEIAVLDVGTREIERRIRVSNIGAIKDPAWSPDGRQIAFVGIKGGLSDLYLVDVEGGTARQLTNDRYMDLQPAWSPDGQTLAFSTDRGPGTTFERLATAEPRLALFDLETSEIRLLSLFESAKHINPQYSPDGESLYFIADRGGFSNVYRTELDTGEVFQVTNIATGISGITNLSPALSVAAQTGLLMYSVFEAQNYNIYALAQEEATGTPVTGTADTIVEDGIAEAGVLPPVDAVDRSVIQGYLADKSTGLPDTRTFPDESYSPKLSLDFVTQPSVGAGYDPYYGFGVGGGVAMRFSDVLGNNILGVTVQANGSFKDIGGQVFYLNQRQRLNWGGTVSHIPFLQVFSGIDDIEGTEGDPRCDDPRTPEADACINGTRIYQRIYLSQVAGLAAYPLSQTRRFEGSFGYRRIGYGFEYDDYFVDDGNLRVERNDLDIDMETLPLAEAGAAYVGDYSFFGFTSPVRGGRYRFGIEGTAGSLNYATATADYRRYLYLPPFLTFAARALHYGRYGPDGESGELYPLFLGYGTLIRGYRYGSFETRADLDTIEDRLHGSRIGVANVELRFPFLGTSQFGLIDFPYLPTELTLFADAGIAWGRTGDRFSRFDPVTGEIDTLGQSLSEQTPVFSAGAAARVNVLGALVLEFYYAFPFSREDDVTSVFGVNLSPGW